jgi:hypothetical protein
MNDIHVLYGQQQCNHKARIKSPFDRYQLLFLSQIHDGVQLTALPTANVRERFE